MSFLELTEKRFSARKYTDEPVSEVDLNYVLECVRLAPSAVNRQPWRFVVVESEAAKQSLWEAYDREWFRSAPLAIVCLQHKGECWTRAADGKAHGENEVASAEEHLSLAAAERGLGTGWSGHPALNASARRWKKSWKEDRDGNAAGRRGFTFSFSPRFHPSTG